MSAYRQPPSPAPLAHAVVPLWAGSELIGPCTVIACPGGVVGVASANALLRADGRPLAIGIDADGGATVAVLGHQIARYVGTHALRLAPTAWPLPDVTPLAYTLLGDVSAAGTVAVTAVGVEAQGDRWRRVQLPLATTVRQWASRGGAGDDRETMLARAEAPVPTTIRLDGAAVIAHHPASRVLGLPAETRVIAIACASRHAPAHDPQLELVPIDPQALAAAGLR